MFEPFVVSLATVWIGTLFTYSASLKLVQGLAQNVRAVEGYRLLPHRVARVVGVLLPLGELAVGVLILVTPFTRVGAAFACIFGALFFLVTASVLARGVKTTCGCAGELSEPVGWMSVVRSVAILLAGIVTFSRDASVPFALGAGTLALALVPATLLAVLVRLRARTGRTAPIGTGIGLRPTARASRSAPR